VNSCTHAVLLLSANPATDKYILYTKQKNTFKATQKYLKINFIVKHIEGENSPYSFQTTALIPGTLKGLSIS